ncbi:MFS transporter [Micromonospora sp. WMMD729]|uniref:MFS transporter n=1 Tax=Micromonospora sp. WMMD729 TaxID=3404127 RepID=UPI003BF4CF19
MLELLRDLTYLKYWLAVVVSFLGDAMSRITLIYVAATLVDNPAVIALVIMAQLLPSGVLGAFIGPLADRVSKRVLLIGADLGRIVIVLAMIPALRSVSLLLVLILLEGVGKAFFETARIAAIPKIIGSPQRIPAAVTLFQSTNHTLNLLGPALGGLLLVIGNVSVVMMINAATFAGSALLLAAMPVLREVPTAAAGGHEPYWQALRTGVRAVLSVASLRFLAAFLVPIMVVLGLFTTNFNAQLLMVFDLPALEYGVAQAVFGGGCVIGALLGPAMMRRLPAGRALVVSVGLFALTLLALAPVDGLTGRAELAGAATWCLLTGISSSLLQVPIATAILRDLGEEVRGRGVGLINSIMVLLTIAGVGLGGLIATAWGVTASIIVAGVALIVATAVFVRPALRLGTARPGPTPAAPDRVAAGRD